MIMIIVVLAKIQLKILIAQQEIAVIFSTHFLIEVQEEHL